MQQVIMAINHVDAKYFGVIKIVFQLVLKFTWAKISLQPRRDIYFPAGNFLRPETKTSKNCDGHLKENVVNCSWTSQKDRLHTVIAMQSVLDFI